MPADMTLWLSHLPNPNKVAKAAFSTCKKSFSWLAHAVRKGRCFKATANRLHTCYMYSSKSILSIDASIAPGG